MACKANPVSMVVGADTIDAKTRKSSKKSMPRIGMPVVDDPSIIEFET